MNTAPIIVFAYNRPDHLRRTLEALAKNNLANDSELFIYCDGAKDSASKEQQERIAENRKVAHATTGFKSVKVIEREKNIGLKANIVGAVTEIVNRYNRVITLEDDIITSPGFLRYMTDALELYKDDEQVMHVTGYMYPHKWPLPETCFFAMPCPWGWGTWKRAWQYYNDDAKELHGYWSKDWDTFNKVGGTFLQRQLVDNYKGTLNTWFVKWHAVTLKMGGLTLYPGQSLTNNNGFDNSATNCYETDKYEVVLKDSVEVKRIPIRENRLVAHEIYAFYQGRWYNKRRREALFNKIKSIFHV